MSDEFNSIHQKLLGWYNSNKRDLPWRSTSDPYKIWISEIVLQQTRVAQGTQYFEKLIERFPDVSSLAMAGQDDLLKLWQGLGYYSRARNLHFAARQVLQEFGGLFPSSYHDLLRLKGVGPYTAAAIASISGNEAVAVVDGNVERVLSRLFMIEEAVNEAKGKKIITELATEMLDKTNAGEFNQALMELGALVCSPKNPKCEECPLNVYCQSHIYQKQEQFPVKTRKAKQRTRHFNYFLVAHQNSVFLRKRVEGDIWQGLYEPVLIETDEAHDSLYMMDLFIDRLKLSAYQITLVQTSGTLKHILTHQIIKTIFYQIKVTGEFKKSFSIDGYERIPRNQILQYPVSRLLERFFETLPKNETF